MNKKIAVIFILCIGLSNFIIADDWNKLIDLKGYWKFNIGDDTAWASIKHDDSNWDEIRVPSAWENEGYHDYNGYAWYRKHFSFSDDIKNRSVYLHLGYIDDVDEVYLNGKLISGSGSFPPTFETAYNAERKYFIPANLLYQNKDNIIAVRVYDERLSGGIHYGEISLQYMNTVELKINLEGSWKFRTGDDEKFKETNFNDVDWEKIIVPSKWEKHGYADYNGFAWYRKEFFLPKNLKNEKFVIVLGRIDDIDECYINGKLVGSTGDFIVTPKFNDFDNEWQEFRGYYIPQNLLKFNEANIIAVRVYDGYLDGGIYEGPIGLTTQKIYTKYWKEKKKKKSFWDAIFDN
jgi:sialate O-acetylesterase